MSVHTFMTGLRGVLAPAAAFAAVEHLSLGWMAALACALIVAGSALLLPEVGWFRRTRADAGPARAGGGAVVEETPD